MGYISELRKIVGHRTLIMPCACVIIGDGKGNILLQKRVDDGTWGYHGGAIEIDESVEDALRREVYEELNIELDEIKLFGIYSGPKYHHIYPNKDETSCIDIIYVCEKYHGDMKLQEEEVSKIEWFNKENVPENISINHQDPIKDYFKTFE